jgi:hypothetical protein
MDIYQTKEQRQMNANGKGQFREDELVSRKVKVGPEWQTRVFPVVGGRLRIFHETNDHVSIQTEIVRLDLDFVVVKAAVESQTGKFNGTGTASAQRDARLADSLVELAETRAIARALRFGGIGVEYTGAEEVSHVAATEPERRQANGKDAEKLFSEDVAKTNPEANPPNGGPTQSTDDTKREQNTGNGRATQAQCRALWTMTKKARYTEEDIFSLLGPLNASTFQELSRESASQLIAYLQTEVAA